MNASLSEIAYRRLREHIFALRLRPGEALVERRLETLLSLSRTPIRSALARLERDGLVRATQRHGGRGYVVAPLDRHEIAEACDFRLMLELESVRRAAARADSGGARLASLLEAAESLRDSEDWLQAATDFHLSLARMAGNRFLYDALAAVLPRIERARLLQVMSERPRNQHEHREIVARMRAGDGPGACRLMEHHVTQSKQQLLDALARQQRDLLAGGAEVES